jgi:hypothetical protein
LEEYFHFNINSRSWTIYAGWLAAYPYVWLLWSCLRLVLCMLLYIYIL